MLFLVTGIDHAGQAFSGKFESSSQERLQTWMLENGVTVNTVSALPLTSGPYSKLPWLILAFPALAGLLIYTSFGLIKLLFFEAQTHWIWIGAALSLEIILAIVIYNILSRLGLRYDFDDGRILQYSRGECIAVLMDDNDDAEMR
jgi:hypothetical protein